MREFKKEVSYMKLVKWEPRKERDSFKDFVDRGKGFEGLIHFPLALSAKHGSADLFGDRAWQMGIDVQDHKKEVVAKVNVPGLKKEQLDVVIEGNYLIVRGEKLEEKELKGKKRSSAGRYYAAFEKGITLPSWVNESKAEAACKGGVLSIRMPKKGVHEAKHVHVHVA